MLDRVLPPRKHDFLAKPAVWRGYTIARLKDWRSPRFHDIRLSTCCLAEAGELRRSITSLAQGGISWRYCHRPSQRGQVMKVNIEIDCTPLEARQFIGLPDIAPMQTAVMDKLQQQMMSNIDKMSPEALIQSWLNFDPKLTERFQDMFVAMAGLGGSRSVDKKK